MMDIVFGLWADPGAWPEHGGAGAAASGAPVVGPGGLLDIIETARGLGAPAAANVVRIAAFEAALERLDGPPSFWSRSLEVDGWATARTLLQWRDDLVAAGWTGEAEWRGDRLSDLARAHRAADRLPAGIADRLAALVADLEAAPVLPIHRIRLIDERDNLGIGWRRLIDRLERCGVRIERVEMRPAAPEDTSLGRLQRWMRGEAPLSGEADGTVTIATSASAALAAELVGQWIAEKGPGAVLVAQEADTHLLDHGLCAAGQPRAGRSRVSAHRGSLQILLLAFKTGWAPFDPRALMELLAFPASPIAPRAGRRLAAALEQAPGRGSPVWEQAWGEIEGAEREDAQGDPGKLKAAESRMKRWRDWASPVLADADEGMELAAALDACDRTVAWATRRQAAEDNPLYGATAGLAADVRQALVALGRDRIPRTQIERIIDQALDVGHDNPMAAAEAAPWRCVPHPGAVWGPADTILWWNFRTTNEALERSPWTEAERAELAERGCSLDDPGVTARAVSASWERAVMNARGHLLLVAGGLDSGDDEALHPLAHRLAPATERLACCVRIEDALSRERLELAGIELRREAVPPGPLPSAQARWTVPTGYRERLEGLEHSATSFEDGLGCHLKWALRHVAKLRPGRVRSIPDANQLLGNLAHRLAEAIFPPGAPPPPEEAAGRAADLLDGLIDEMAAPLRHSELAAQLADARERLPSAMAELAKTLAENDLVVEASEMQVSFAFEDALAVRGAVDLVARDPDGNPVIIDLKWTRSAKKRFDELRAGNAVQLAAYGAMVAEGGPYRAGYFLLNQRQFATLANSGLIGRSVSGQRGFPDTWNAVRESWRRLSELAEAGTFVACGVEGHEDHLPADLPILLEANCQWCDYQTLCRVRGLK